jgi:hypothetical protein
MKKVQSGEGATDLGSVEKQYEPPLDYQKQEIINVKIGDSGQTIPLPSNVHMYHDDGAITLESGPMPAAAPDYRDGYEVTVVKTISVDDVVDIIYANWVVTAGHTFNNTFPRWIQHAAEAIVGGIKNP